MIKEKMSLIHERTFKVRHYECDPYGHVNHANYVRYMQEAAFDATAAAGYDLPRYEAMERMWLVRHTDITYLHPLIYGDTVIVKTWVVDFRRVRSRRAYELRLAASGDIVAQAMTDWVFLDRQTLRPVSIPAELIQAFMPDGHPPDGHPPDGLPVVVPPREPFPQAPPPPAGIFKMRIHVEWRDIDGAQHANNATYITYLENCSIQVAASFGWPMSRMRAAGFGIIARRYRIEYLQPALEDDELEAATWVSDVKRATAVRHYTIHRVTDGALLARAHGLWVWVDLASGRPVRVPADFLADFAANIVDQK
jgi:acyl-CoA thioester hydrolase